MSSGCAAVRSTMQQRSSICCSCPTKQHPVTTVVGSPRPDSTPESIVAGVTQRQLRIRTSFDCDRCVDQWPFCDCPLQCYAALAKSVRNRNIGTWHVPSAGRRYHEACDELSVGSAGNLLSQMSVKVVATGSRRNRATRHL